MLTNPFWKDVFKSYSECYINISPKTSQEINKVKIYNTLIKVVGSPIRNKQYLKHGVHLINDVIDKDGSFLTYEQFKSKYGHIVNLFEYNSLLSSIKNYLKRLEICPDLQLLNHLMPLPLSILLNSLKGCRQIYDRIIHTNKTFIL